MTYKSSLPSISTAIVMICLAFCVAVTLAYGAAPPAPSESPRSPDESARLFTVANDDLVWEQVLAEPQIAQPVHMKFDERGRLWVVQYRQYPYPEGVKVLSRDKHWRVQYDQVPKAPPHHERGRDKITIHEDTGGDGKFDKHKTFVDGLNLATAVEVGRGGIWVLNPPYLLFYPDKNQDDVPDGDPEVHLSGFGLSDSHSVVNSLAWGPDGWLYGAQGSTVHGDVVTYDAKGLPIGKPVHSMGQLIWRYHPEQRKYEIFAEGGGNAFGLEIDSKGRIFSGHNGGDTRGFHYVQGGYYRKGFSKHGPLSNPYAFGYFEAMGSHKVPRFTHAFVIYESNALPARYHGRLFGVEPLQSQIVLSDVQPDRSSFKTDDINRPITSEDKWFRPVDIKVGPDGAIYVADFFERFPSHREHYEGKVFAEDGRIYRLAAKDRATAKSVDLSSLPEEELVEKLRSPNRTIRQLALRVLGDRKNVELPPVLIGKLEAAEGQLALEYLWAINTSGGFDHAAALVALSHDDPHVRAWAIRLACDDPDFTDGDSGAPLLNRFYEMARRETNIEVRTQLACSARRLPAEACLQIVRLMVVRDSDGDDVFQPLLLWWAMESKCEEHAALIFKMMDEHNLWNQPLVHEHLTHRLMRRFAAPGTRQGYLHCAELFALAPNLGVKKRLLQGFEEAVEGKLLAGIPNELASQIEQLGGGSLALRVRGGRKKAIDEALRLLTDDQADRTLRRELIAVFAEVDQPTAIDPLLAVAKNPEAGELSTAALTTLQSYGEQRIADAALELVASDSTAADTSAAAVDLMVSRQSWCSLLLKAVDQRHIKPESIDEAALRRILLHDDKANAELIKKHWGDVAGATTESMRKQIQQLTVAIRKGDGDPYAGKKHYRMSCGKCHQLFQEGADIGPNLTSYQRDNLEAMLLHVVNPSAEIREGFESFNVFTEDGRVLNGFLADQDKSIVVLRDGQGARHTLRRADIEEMNPSPRSIMPERLLDELTPEQVRDLFAYLRSRQPLND